METLSKEVQEEITSLISSHREKFVRIISRRYYNATKEDIEDCLQDLFVVAYENYESFNASQNKIGWLFISLRNILSNNLKASKKRRIAFSKYINKPNRTESFEDDILFGILTKHLSEDTLIKEIFSHFSSSEIELYNLRYKEKLSTKDIAKKLGIPHGTVRRRLFDLNRKVRKIIESGIS